MAVYRHIIGFFCIACMFQAASVCAEDDLKEALGRLDHLPAELQEPIVDQALGPVRNQIRSQLLEDAGARNVRRLDARDYECSAAYSPDGKHLSVGRDSIRVYDVDTGDLRQEWNYRGPAGSLKYSPDGRYLTVISSDDYVVFNAQTGERVRRLVHGNAAGKWIPTAIAYSPDSRLIASAGWGGRVCVWEIATGKQLHFLQGHESMSSAVAFSPDGRRLVSGGSKWDNTMRVWDVQAGKEVGRLPCDKGISSISFSPNGEKMLTSSWWDSALRIWDARTMESVDVFHHGGDRCVNSFYSSDGGIMVSWSWNGRSIKIWNAETREELCTFVYDNMLKCVTLSPDGKQLAVSFDSQKGVKVLDLYDEDGKRVLDMLHSAHGLTIAQKWLLYILHQTREQGISLVRMQQYVEAIYGEKNVPELLRDLKQTYEGLPVELKRIISVWPYPADKHSKRGPDHDI